ncbi:MAG: DinB family protein [Gemmatimonas sp.]
MSTREKWFERSFDFSLPVSRMPGIIERLRGTPARLIERTQGLSPTQLVERRNGAWSIQENVGHLIDLEALWLRRAAQLFGGEPKLAPTDLANRQTDEAQHNARVLSELLEEFQRVRMRFIELLLTADASVQARTATHPRLGTPMRLIDLALFVAEHDDHHLATITALRAS